MELRVTTPWSVLTLHTFFEYFSRLRSSRGPDPQTAYLGTPLNWVTFLTFFVWRHTDIYILYFSISFYFFTIPVDPTSLYLMQNDIFNTFKNPVIIYSALFCSRPLWLYFVCGTQNNMLLFWTPLTLILWTKEMQTFLKISSFVYTGFKYHNVHNATNGSFKNWNVLWGTQNDSSMQL